MNLKLNPSRLDLALFNDNLGETVACFPRNLLATARHLLSVLRERELAVQALLSCSKVPFGAHDNHLST